MKTCKTVASIALATCLVSASHDAYAAKSVPASMAEMWKIIQQQQKEIEALKAKADENEALKQEVKSLQEAQKGEAKPQSQAVVTPATDVGENSAAKLAQTTVAAKPAKSETERKTDILAAEVEKLKTKLFIPEKREYKSQYGLGPAASEVYRVNRGLSIGGYGELFYTDYTANKGDRKNTVDLARAVLYAGYKFNDWIVLNNEFEFEHATTGEGSEQRGEVSVEFSYLDFLLHKNANIRVGMMLMPMGFINEIHEPVTFHGNRRPDVEQYIIPTTWSELGGGLFGQIVPGLQYRMYAVNGLNAKGYTSAGIREGRQEGSFAVAENWAFTGRLDYTPNFAPSVLMGASAYVGDAGQGEFYLGQKVNALTQLYEGHIQWHYRGLEMRTLGALGFVGNANVLSAANVTTVGKQNYGLYTELAYDVMPYLWRDSTQYLAPFFRYERYNTLASVPDGFDYDKKWDRWIYQVGLTYKPIQNIAIKADYRNIHSSGGGLPHEFNLGLGFIY
jgi:hypothetical protein